MSIRVPTKRSVVSTPPGIPEDLVWRLSVDQYHRMIREGILTDDDPVELLDGWLIPKMPKNPAHRVATRLTRMALERAIPPGWYVETQEPVTLALSEPEPDLAVILGDTRDYLDRHPGPQEVVLVVEIADTTLERDRVFKKRLYAEAGIPFYWIINLPERMVEVHHSPDTEANPPDYRTRQLFTLGTGVPLEVGNDPAEIRVADLLP